MIKWTILAGSAAVVMACAADPATTSLSGSEFGEPRGRRERAQDKGAHRQSIRGADAHNVRRDIKRGGAGNQ